MTKLSMLVTVLAGLLVIYLGYKLFSSFDVNANATKTNSVIDTTAKDLVSPIMNNPSSFELDKE